MRDWWERLVRRAFLRTLRGEPGGTRAVVGRDYPRVAVEYSACPRCYGNEVAVGELAEIPTVSCLECGLFMGTCGTRNLNVTAATWNLVAAVQMEQVRLAESIRQCPRLRREIATR